MAKTLFVDTESQPSGTAVTAQPGGNSNFNAIAGTQTFDSAQAFHGTRSIKVGPSSGAASYGAKTGLSATDCNMWGYEYFTATPAADTYLGRFLVGSTRILSVHINAAGKLRVSDNTGTAGVTGWSGSAATASAAVIPLSQWWRWEIYGHIGAGASNGTILFAYFLGDSTTPIETLTISGAANLGTAAITVLNCGKSDAGTYASAFWTDDAGYDPTATGLPGPYISGTPGTVSAPVSMASAAAPVPAVTADTFVTGGGPATGSAAAPAPSIAAGATATASPSTGVGNATAPTISAGGTVTSSGSSGAASAASPIVNAGATAAGVAATGTAIAPAPSIGAGGSATVAAPAATGTSTGRVPAISAGWSVGSVAAIGSAAAQPPFLSVGGSVPAPAAFASARAFAPTIGGPLPRDITVTVLGPYRHPLRDTSPRGNPLRVTGATR